jgi:serine/threonine-protein kinase RsbW
MQKRRVLIVDNDDELRHSLDQVLRDLGHEPVATGDRTEALSRNDLDQFDLIISDLTDDPEPDVIVPTDVKRLMIPLAVGIDNGQVVGIVKAFKLAVCHHSRFAENNGTLREILDKTLGLKLRYARAVAPSSLLREKIEFELPSDIELMNSVLNFLTGRVGQFGVVDPEHSNLFVALDEAFVNAVRHGNKNDKSKCIRISADLSSNEACFTVEDEGEGFDLRSIPDPCDPENLFKTSGRGVLLICNIMDEVEYNDRGNRLKMIKRSEAHEKEHGID